jgi:transposase
MVNFRVGSLDAVVAQLRAAGIAVEIDAEQYPNGRFARLYDPEGNPIELLAAARPRDARRRQVGVWSERRRRPVRAPLDMTFH